MTEDAKVLPDDPGSTTTQAEKDEELMKALAEAIRKGEVTEQVGGPDGEAYGQECYSSYV